MDVVVATGITADGSREILGLDGDSKDEVFWPGILTSLKQRGLPGSRWSSQTGRGLVNALEGRPDPSECGSE